MSYLFIQNEISRLSRLKDLVILIFFAVQDEQLTAADRRLKVSQAYRRQRL